MAAALCFAFVSGAAAAEPGTQTAEDWRKAAEVHLKAGDKLQAAEAYEQVVRMEPLARVQLAPVLARLYAETKTPDQALGWAKVAMERSPDPRAYLAGIHQTLGQKVQAESILAGELAKTNAPPRTVSLSKQLADLQLSQGETNAAIATLEKAVQAVTGSPEAARAKMRLQMLKRRSEPHRGSR